MVTLVRPCKGIGIPGHSVASLPWKRCVATSRIAGQHRSLARARTPAARERRAPPRPRSEATPPEAVGRAAAADTHGRIGAGTLSGGGGPAAPRGPCVAGGARGGQTAHTPSHLALRRPCRLAPAFKIRPVDVLMGAVRVEHRPR